MTRILLTRRWPDAAMARMAELGQVTVSADDQPMDADQLAQAFASHDVVCPTVSDRIDAHIIEAGKGSVQLIANFGVGTDHIDLAAARALGIPVTNTPGVLTDATAEIAITLMLMSARRAGEGERELRAGQWRGWRPTHLLGTGLRGKSLGLVGYGRIGQRVAEMAHHGLGMTILQHGRSKRSAPGVPARYFADLAEMLPLCDVLSLHVPGGSARSLIGAAELALLPRHAILINTARGDVLDEDALVDALEMGRLAGAGLDVYRGEPHISPRLMAAPNTVLLPHLGSATLETRTAMGLKVVENVAAFLHGQPLPDRAG